MGPRTRALIGLALLLLAAGHLGAAALQLDPCEDDCAPACGDCGSCPPLASLAASPSLSPGPARVASLATIAASAPIRAARAIEHVPLGPTS